MRRIGLILVALLSLSLGAEKNPWERIILRIDDGPSSYTEKLVETLRKLKIKNVMFFIIGENLLNKQGKIDEKKAEILKKIAKEGWEIGNHTMHHPLLDKKGKDYFVEHPEEWEKEIEGCQEILFKILGFYPKFFASPGIPAGKNLPEKLKEIVKSLGLEFDSGWGIDSQDSRKGKKRLSAQEIAERIKKTKGKIIILLHDKKETSEFIEKIDETLKG